MSTDSWLNRFWNGCCRGSRFIWRDFRLRPILFAVILLASAKVVLFFWPEFIKLSDFLNIAGFLAGIYAAVEAAHADRRAGESLAKLKETALIIGEARDTFSSLFSSYLVQPLSNYGHTPVEAHLLLSTPAYGFPVLGGDEYSRFQKAMVGLDADSEIELIFFCPDAHIQHWVNTLLWSHRRERRQDVQPGRAQPDSTFAIEFGKSIRQMLAFFQNPGRRWHLWVTDEVTLRLFAFKPLRTDSGPISHDDEPNTRKVYLVISDRIRIAADQWERSEMGVEQGFRGRGFPVLQPLAGSIVGGPNSYFDQLKRCPYSLAVGEDAAISNTSEDSRLKHLMRDYILGRTEQQVLDFDCFQYEMTRYLQSLRAKTLVVETVTLTESKITSLRDAVQQVAGYFARNINDGETDNNEWYGPYLGQTLVVAMAANYLRGLEPPDSIPGRLWTDRSVETLANSFSMTAYSACQFVEIEPSGLEQYLPKYKDDPRWTNFVQMSPSADAAAITQELKLRDIYDAWRLVTHKPLEEKLKFALYALLTSGFRESAYAANARRLQSSSQQTDAAAAAQTPPA